MYFFLLPFFFPSTFRKSRENKKRTMLEAGSATFFVLFNSFFLSDPYSRFLKSETRVLDGVRVSHKPQARAYSARSWAVLGRKRPGDVHPDEALLLQEPPRVRPGIVVSGDAIFQPLPRLRYLQVGHLS